MVINPARGWSVGLENEAIAELQNRAGVHISRLERLPQAHDVVTLARILVATSPPVLLPSIVSKRSASASMTGLNVKPVCTQFIDIGTLRQPWIKVRSIHRNQISQNLTAH